LQRAVWSQVALPRNIDFRGTGLPYFSFKPESLWSQWLPYIFAPKRDATELELPSFTIQRAYISVKTFQQCCYFRIEQQQGLVGLN
jgi:hypothetical protein